MNVAEGVTNARTTAKWKSTVKRAGCEEARAEPRGQHVAPPFLALRKSSLLEQPGARRARQDSPSAWSGSKLSLISAIHMKKRYAIRCPSKTIANYPRTTSSSLLEHSRRTTLMKSSRSASRTKKVCILEAVTSLV